MRGKKPSRNRVTAAGEIADELPEADYYEIRTNGGQVVLEAVRAEQAADFRRRLELIAFFTDDIDEALAWARMHSSDS